MKPIVTHSMLPNHWEHVSEVVAQGESTPFNLVDLIGRLGETLDGDYFAMRCAAHLLGVDVDNVSLHFGAGEVDGGSLCYVEGDVLISRSADQCAVSGPIGAQRAHLTHIPKPK